MRSTVATDRAATTEQITTLQTSVAGNTSSIQELRSTVATDNAATAEQITTLQTSVNGNTSSIQTQATSIDGLKAQYTVKVDAGGQVAGFGLASEPSAAGPNTSNFVVLADKFAVGAPGKTNQFPFVIDTATNTVAINGALAVTGSISGNAMAADSVTTDKIAANAVTVSEIAANAVTADKISVTNLAAINSNLGAISAGSLNIGAGKFVVSTAGDVTIRNGTTGQRVEITNSVIRVYDTSNVLRVRMGIW